MENSRGIQQLMEAEHSATKIVQEMREAKVERMKQAKVEAAEVVDKYRSDKESEFKAKASSTDISAESVVLEEQTAADVAQMKINFEKNKQDVIQMLLSHVTNVNIE
mmetsp:Transcript_24779/g.32265  ORF Transcript_24779/g.32265 Transcript_24779/m.32265 type:complete len:107 (+) Transcript_24779:134-454(+)|eukprot:CAMPEP_0114336328 /NCGR_PEP_ID=MMETSP0101-20121206/5633_1 /TAXON_ID=38822 ORGANISM="Pteridomonas danica, Strain PT" /NCGR_SAMPLE_ID=MMETSP0101 /ASSEMBLY_ACC=CAM_ASM_000211 /LENGTH=106 /DNA_ID=CAMNT_0001468213 /DNA_START=48 /DNA_END=368 /DNA_ORIENTATION=+